MAGNRRQHELVMSLVAKMGPNFQQTFANAANSTNTLRGSINELRTAQSDITAYQKTETAVNSLRGELAELEGATNRNEKKIESKAKQLAAAEERLAGYSSALKEAGVDTNNLASENQRLQQEAERLATAQRNLSEATQRVTENKAAQKAANRQLLMGVGQLTAGVAAAYAAFVQPLARFEGSLSDVRAQTGMTSEEIEELGETFREMGRGSNHSAQQIAEAYARVAVRGQDVEHSTELMRTSMVLANAVGGDLGNTAYFLGNYLLKVGKDVSYAERYMNVFAHTSQGTGIGLNTLQDYLFRANAALGAAGISGTAATAIFGNLYQAGIRGAYAYSGFSQSIESLMNPSNNAQAALRRLGVDTQQMIRDGYDMTEIMFQVGDAMDDVTDEIERASLMQELFSQQSARAFADELFTQRDTLRELIPELYEVGDAAHGMGAAYQIAGDRMGNHQAQTQQLRSTMEDIRLSIGEGLMPTVNDMMGRFSESAGRAAEWAAENQELIGTIAKVAFGLGAAKVALLAFKAAHLKVKGVVLSVKAAKAGYKAVQAAANAGTSISIALQKKELAGTGALAGAVLAKTKLLLLGNAARKAAVASTVAHTAVTKKATVAQWLHNVAMMANPKVLIIMAIIALIAGLVALTAILIRSAGAQERANQRAEEFKEATAENSAALRDNATQLERSGQGNSQLAEAYRDGAAAIDRQRYAVADAIRTFRLSEQATEGLQEAHERYVQAVQARIDIVRELEGIERGFADTQLAVMDAEDRVEAAQRRATETIRRYGEGSRQAGRAQLELESAQNRLAQASSRLEDEQYMLANATEILEEATWEQIRVQAATQVEFATTTNCVEDLNNTLAQLTDDGCENSIRLRDQIIEDATTARIRWNEEMGKMEVDNRNWVQRLFNTNGSGRNSIPRYHTGSNFTPDTFVAGDINGRGGELVTNARGRKVFTAAQTSDIFRNIKAAQAMQNNSAPSQQMQSLSSTSNTSQSVQMSYSPVIHVNGNAPGDLESRLRASAEDVREIVQDCLRENADNSWRMRYA